MDIIPGRPYIGYAACPICERSESFDGKRLSPILGATLRQRLVQSEVKHIHTRRWQGNLGVTLVRVQRRFWRQPVFQPVCSSNRTPVAAEAAGGMEQQVMEFPITKRPSVFLRHTVFPDTGEKLGLIASVQERAKDLPL